MNDAADFGRQLRDALGQFATGVTVVTAVGPEGEPAGITVNSFTSLSLDPPLVLWNLSRGSANWDAFQGAQHFAVHVLAAGQEAMALEFAKPGGDPFDGVAVETGNGGVPLLPGVLAQFECRLADRHDGGDHVTLVGEVLKYREFSGEPLLFYRGRFGHFTAT